MKKEKKSWKDQYLIDNRRIFIEKSNTYVECYFFHSKIASSDLVIICHGTGNDALYPNQSFIQNLVNNGVSVFSFDLDGHGRNSTTILDSNHFIECLERIWGYFWFNHKKYRIHLFGYSIGSLVVLKTLSSNLRQHITSAILVATPIFVEKVVPSLLCEVKQIFSKQIWRQVGYYDHWYELIPAIGTFKRTQYPIRILEKPSGFLFYKDKIKSIIKNFNIANICKDIDLPIMICYGEYDKISPPLHAAYLKEKLSKAVVIKIDSANHFTTMLDHQIEISTIKWIKSYRKV